MQKTYASIGVVPWNASPPPLSDACKVFLFDCRNATKHNPLGVPDGAPKVLKQDPENSFSVAYIEDGRTVEIKKSPLCGDFIAVVLWLALDGADV
jgi:hypothetical protein